MCSTYSLFVQFLERLSLAKIQGRGNFKPPIPLSQALLVSTGLLPIPSFFKFFLPIFSFKLFCFIANYLPNLFSVTEIIYVRSLKIFVAIVKDTNSILVVRFYLSEISTAEEVNSFCSNLFSNLLIFFAFTREVSNTFFLRLEYCWNIQSYCIKVLFLLKKKLRCSFLYTHVYYKIKTWIRHSMLKRNR